jgi:glycosyltransferase involved in cell wall biosynthesis
MIGHGRQSTAGRSTHTSQTHVGSRAVGIVRSVDEHRYEVAVVMPAFNAARTIESAIRAVLAQDTPRRWEFVVADNGSSDDTVAIAEALTVSHSNASVIDASHRPGSNGARNAGVEATSAPLLLFCDSDDIVMPGWIDALADQLGTAALVGGRLDEDALNDPRFDERLVARPGLPKVLGFLPWAVGANMGIRRSTLEAVGAFDETWNAAGDDIDLSWRIQLAGFEIGYAEDGVVQYRHRSDLGSIFRRAHRFLLAESRLLHIYRDRGARWRGARSAGRSWIAAVLMVPRAFSGIEHRRALAWTLGALSGRLRGSIRHRVVNL